MVSIGAEYRLSNKITLMVAEYWFALSKNASDAVALRFLTNGKDTGGGVSYRMAISPPIIDNGLWLGIGLDVISEYLGVFTIPEVEAGYTLFIGGRIALNIEGTAGYAIDVAHSSAYNSSSAVGPSGISQKPSGENGGGFDYGIGARISYGW